MATGRRRSVGSVSAAAVVASLDLLDIGRSSGARARRSLSLSHIFEVLS